MFRRVKKALTKVASQADEVDQDRLTRMLKINRKQLCRRTGVYPETFAVLSEREARKKKFGRPAALSVAEQLLMTLQF